MHGASFSGSDLRTRLHSIVGGSIGNLIEWYDWSIYGSVSLYFAPSFFPDGDPTAQLLGTSGIFALGFVMRPLGGWLLGAYADRHGRRAALTGSVLLMGLGSLLVALTPDYASIGVMAPTLLLVARLLQGLSVGGEYGASATYLSEMAPRGLAGFCSSFQYVTLVAGQLLALLVLIGLQHMLSPADLVAWSWRLPFVIGAVGALGALFIRRRIQETDAFVRQDVMRSTRSLTELMRYRREVVTVVGLTLGGTVAFYTFTTYTQKFLVNTTGWSKEAATMLSASALSVFLVLQPLVGWISDRTGRRPVLIAFGVLGSVATVPVMTVLAHVETFGAAFVLVLGALVIVSGYTSINAVVKAELFPAEVRAIGVAFPYAITVSIFGGTAEYVALWLRQHGHEPWFYYYVASCIAISLTTYWLMPEPSGKRELA